MGNHRQSVPCLWSTPPVATARGFITPSSPSSLWGLWPPLPGVVDSFLVPFVFVRVDVPTLYPALRHASRLAIWTVGNPFSLSTRGRYSRAISEVVALVALVSGIALSPQLLSRYGRHSKGRDPVSVLRVRTSRSLASCLSPASHAIRSACTELLRTSLAGTLPAASAGTLLPLTIADTSTAEWLSSPGDSPRPPPAPAIVLYSREPHIRLRCVMV